MTLRWCTRLAVAFAIAVGAVSSHARVAANISEQLAAPGLPQDIPLEALDRIEALLREKASRSPIDRKIDSQLLYQLRMEANQPVAPGVERVETDIPYAPDGHAIVDVNAQVTDVLLSSLAALGTEVVSTDPNHGALRLHITINQVRQIAALPGVTFVQPRQDARTRQARPNVLFTQTGQGSRTSEGDITHLAFAARTAFAADGTGAKIGVLSDGVANLAASQAAGDLGPVTVLPGQAGTGDEGTAMLEIIHDLAPGAELFFATAFGSITSFADNIRALRQAGCDIIVDDVFYFVESPFQDGQTAAVMSSTNGGAVTQAVNEVTANGALYFSSAGNSGNLNASTSGTWEGDFLDGGATGPKLPSGRLHSFGMQTFNLLTNAGNATNVHWSDPLGASGNDYDLFALASNGNVLAASTNVQSGMQDPYEQMSAVNGDRIVIVKTTGAADRFLHLGTLGGTLSIPTAGEIHGHAAAAQAFAVAATPARGPFPQPFDAASVVEWFSSDGPRRLFYQGNGTPFTPGNVSSTGGTLRQKPDITAADGVSVTGAGGFPSTFYGTSAAAPHAAAIAALLKSANAALTAANIRAHLLASAIDIGIAGVDRDSGAGIVMADAMMRAAGVPGGAHLEVTQVFASESPGNGNGAPEAGEGASLSLPIANYGGATATSVSGNLTSSTPGITILKPTAQAYPDVMAGASQFSNFPFRFTVASNFPCPQSAAFTLTVTSTGGPSPRVFNFQVAIGPPAFSITTTLDATAPPSSPGVATTIGTQQRRLTRDNIVSSCGAPKATPSLFAGSGAVATRRFEAFTFNTCTSSVASCVEVTLDGANAITLFSAAYSPSFDPTNVQQNYKADPGSSSGFTKYSFDLAGGAQTFAIDVHEVNANGGVGTEYTLTVAGACGGACTPPNQVPVAKAKNVTVTADQSGTAAASIDDGSFDPDGPPMPSLTQMPPGPYPIGQTVVILTASDAMGAASQATATVTVNGPPTISIADVVVTEADAGPVTADFVITLSQASTQTINVSADTADDSALSPTDYLSASQMFTFNPGEVTKTFVVAVNADNLVEPDEAFRVILHSAFNANIGDGEALGTIVTDDYATVTEAAVTQAVLNGSLRVKNLQRPDGGWYFKVGDTDCRAGAGVSCQNTVGITALGELAGHTRTGDPTLLPAAKAAADNRTARYNATIGMMPPVLPASQDVEFLVEYGDKAADPAYTTVASNWFQRVVTAYPNAADYVDKLIADAGLYPPVGVWRVGSLIRSAKAVGNMPYAEAAATRVTSPAVEALWKDTNPSHRYDQCGNPNGCGLPNNPFGFEYTLLAMGTLLHALHDMQGYGAKVTDYRTHLLAQQDAGGSWLLGEAQITSYVMFGLVAVGGTGTAAPLESAASWFLTTQLANGGWPAFVTKGQHGPEYTEVDAEAVRGLFAYSNTPQGMNVAVAPAQLSTLTFSEVTSAGFTSVVATDRDPKTKLPGSFTILRDLNYDVLTTARIKGRTNVCFSVPWVTDRVTFDKVRVLHEEHGVLVDRTIRGRGESAPDFDSRRVCARVSSLNRFAIALRNAKAKDH